MRDYQTDSAAQPQSRNGEYRKSNRVLLDERPLVLLPSLAKAVGVNGAVVIQQLHFYRADTHNGRVHDGERWIFKSYDDWQRDDFPFWSAVTIRRIFRALEKRKLVISCQPEGRFSRRKYYRIDYGGLEKAVAPAQEAIKLIGSMRSKVALPLTETTEQRKEKVKGDFRKSSKSHSAFSPKVPYPKSEEKMYRTLEAMGIETDRDRDGNFFTDMKSRNWTLHGERIYDWPELYQRRLKKIHADLESLNK